MDPARRFALIVGVSSFDRLSSLPGAELDRQRMTAFAREIAACDTVLSPESPRLDDVKTALADVLDRARSTDGFVLVYFATHGCMTDSSSGLRLAFVDANLAHLAKTTLSAWELADFVAEYRPRSSVVIVDACEAGGHLGGVGALALKQLWAEKLSAEAVPDGHFVLASCGSHESSQEDGKGGRFTTLFLETVDECACSAPHQELFSTEEIAASVVRRAKSGLPGQTPAWSGLSVTGTVILARNRCYNAGVPAPPSIAQVADIPADERTPLRTATISLWSAANLVGSGQNWSRSAIRTISDLHELAIGESTRRTFILGAARTIAARVVAHGTAEDRDAGQEYLEAALVALGRSGGLGSGEATEVARLLYSQAGERLADSQTWTSSTGWLQGDALANAALAPIRFWDRLGAAGTVALACRVATDAGLEDALATWITEAVRVNPRLYRVTWAGQYPDMAVAFGYVARKDPALARTCAASILRRLLEDASEVRPPVEAGITGRELGRELAKRLYDPTGRPSDVGEEGPALLLAAMRAAEESELALNAHVARITGNDGLQDLCVYEAPTVVSLLNKRIDGCTLHTWHSRTEGSLSALLGYLAGHPRAPFATPNAADLLAAASAARLFRNRACLGLIAAIVELPSVGVAGA